MNAGRRLGVASGNWHRVYYLLALFDVLTVAGGLLLTHRFTDMIRDSVAVNKGWADRMVAYSTLGTLASDVNTTAVDIFKNPDADLPERRLAETDAVFSRAWERARDEADHSLKDPTRQVILRELETVAVAKEEMVVAARRIVASVRANQPVLAEHSLVELHQRHAEVRAGLRHLRESAIDADGMALQEQSDAAKAVRRYEAVIVAAILLMVAGATAYGHTLSRRIKTDVAERDDLIAGLRDSEERLEQRVWDRTWTLSRANADLARLAAIVTSSDDAIVSIDTEGRVLTWNAGATRLFGFTADEIVGQPAMLYVPDDRREEHRGFVAQVMAGESVIHIRTERRRKDGSTFHCDVTASPMYGDGGLLLGAAAILRDVDDELLAHEHLTRATRRLVEAQRMAQVGSWEFDLRTQTVTWSDETFRLFGFEANAIVPTYDAYLALVHPDDRARLQADVARSGETGQPFEHDIRLIRVDGQERTFHTAAEVMLDEHDRPMGMTGTVQDVTDFRGSEAATRESEERFRLAARATNDALWDWNVRTGTVWWNHGFQELFQHPDSRPTVAVWMSLIHPNDAPRIWHGLEAFLESTSEVWIDEYRFRRADGRYAWVLDRGFAIRDGGGRAVRMIGSMLDISERKESERLKSDFVSFVSHQIRTPLSGIRWMLELAAETPGLRDGTAGHIADARESAARLSELVNDLLDVAKFESGRLKGTPEPLGLAALTDSVAAEMAPLVADKALDVEISCDRFTPPVLADAQLMRQVVTNLLSNAMKYTPAGGRITVSLSPHNGSVTWSVRDTGIGVSRGALPRLFEKFYRADNAVQVNAEGTGLGLHLVRLIVAQAGGRVWCESEEGQGATFSFTLPAMSVQKEAV